MSIGTIVLIILVIALLGGFTGFGGGQFYGRALRARRAFKNSSPRIDCGVRSDRGGYYGT